MLSLKVPEIVCLLLVKVFTEQEDLLLESHVVSIQLGFAHIGPYCLFPLWTIVSTWLMTTCSSTNQIYDGTEWVAVCGVPAITVIWLQFFTFPACQGPRLWLRKSCSGWTCGLSMESPQADQTRYHQNSWSSQRMRHGPEAFRLSKYNIEQNKDT